MIIFFLPSKGIWEKVHLNSFLLHTLVESGHFLPRFRVFSPHEEVPNCNLSKKKSQFIY
jgi:hypothetical protein